MNVVVQIHFAAFLGNLLEAMEKLWVNRMGRFGDKMMFESFLDFNYSCHPIPLDQWMTRI